jgi:hypothetical protein
MTDLPEPIDKKVEDREGYRRDKFAEELLSELIDKFNELIEYLREQSGLSNPQNK